MTADNVILKIFEIFVIYAPLGHRTETRIDTINHSVFRKCLQKIVTCVNFFIHFCGYIYIFSIEYAPLQQGDIKDLNIVVKADVQGSVEALNSALLGLNKNDEVRVSIVHSGVGAVSESDIMLATASKAIVIAFNVRPDANARRLADTEDVDIRTYRVIYDALNDVKDAMSGMLKPKYKEVIQGRVEIRQVMRFSKALVAGSYVLEGKIKSNSKIRILRDNVELFDGEIDSLRRFKDEVKEVAAGYECGISIVDFRDFAEGDIIEAYTMEEIETSIAEANKAAEQKREEQAAAAAAKAEEHAEEE